jgi:hypothetical protein
MLHSGLMTKKKKQPLTVLTAIAMIGAAGLIIVVVAVGGPFLLSQTSPVEHRGYASWSEAPTVAEDAAAARPAWAPDDATDIELEYKVRNVPGYTLSMVSETGLDLSSCVRLPDSAGGPAMPSELLPTTLPDRPWHCGDGRAVWQADGTIWSWSTKEPVATGDRADD